VCALVVVPRVGVLLAAHESPICILGFDSFDVVREFSATHVGGVTHMAWCASESFIVSGGADRRVCLWDPHLASGTPVAEVCVRECCCRSRRRRLHASDHTRVPRGALQLRVPLSNNAPWNRIVTVEVNDRHNQVVVVMADGHMRVFDSRTLRCLQTGSDTLLSRCAAALVDPHRGSVVAFGTHVRAWGIKDALPSASTPADAGGAAAAPGGGSAAGDDVLTVLYSPPLRMVGASRLRRVCRRYCLATVAVLNAAPTTRY
jgi:hypothetical protein